MLAQASTPDGRPTRTRPFLANEDRLSELFPDEQRESVDLLVGLLVDALWLRSSACARAERRCAATPRPSTGSSSGLLHAHLLQRVGHVGDDRAIPSGSVCRGAGLRGLGDRERPQRQLGDVGTGLLFENDRVRVWQVRLAPGEQGAVHQHELDHLLIQVAGDRIAVVPEADTRGAVPRLLSRPTWSLGRWWRWPRRRRGGPQRGTEPYLEVIVELKD